MLQQPGERMADRAHSSNSSKLLRWKSKVQTKASRALECEVSEWHLYGFLKGDHVKWKRIFLLIDRSEIDHLEGEGLIDRPERLGFG